MTTILVLGGNFGGMTSPFELRRKLRQMRVVVLSRSKEFVYVPSLIWVPFGRRKVQDITFSAEETLRRGGIEFLHDEAVRIEPAGSKVECASGRVVSYDYLIIATGAELVWESVPGLGPNKFTQSIFTPPDAEDTYRAFQRFLAAPGPAAIGAVPGASCMGAGYEYLFNFDRHVRKHRVRDRVPITWVTPEPALGHFGIGGIRGGELMLKAFLKWQGIDYRANATIKEAPPEPVDSREGGAPAGDVEDARPAVPRRPRDSGVAGSWRREGLRRHRRLVPAPDVSEHLCRGSRRSRRQSLPWIGAIRRAEDRISDRRDGENGCREHSTRHGGTVRSRVQAIWQHSGGLRHGRREQGSVDLDESPVPAKAVRGDVAECVRRLDEGHRGKDPHAQVPARVVISALRRTAPRAGRRCRTTSWHSVRTRTISRSPWAAPRPSSPRRDFACCSLI